METLKIRSFWTDNLQTLKDHWCRPRLLYTPKLLIIVVEENKTLHEKLRFKQFRSISAALHKDLEKNLQPKKSSWIQESIDDK